MRQYSKVSKEQFDNWVSMSREIGFEEYLEDTISRYENAWSNGAYIEKPAEGQEAVGRCLALKILLGLKYSEFISNQTEDDNDKDDETEANS